MVDPRSVLERELARVRLRPFTIDTFHERRERRRRRQRIAAGAVGLAVAVALGAVVGPALLLDRSGDVADPSEPTPAPPARTVRFESGSYGYSARHPADWTVQPATLAWVYDEWPAPIVMDRFVDPVDGVLIAVASVELPEDVAPIAWMRREERRHARIAGLGTSCERDHAIVPTEIDGRLGRLAVDCGVVTVVAGGRGYLIELYADVAIHVELRAVLGSIELEPKEA